jgi:hypothetical protein
VYKQILSGITAFSPEIKLPLKTMREIALIFEAVLLDNPMIFHVLKYKVSYSFSEMIKLKCTFYPVYKYSRSFVAETERRITDYLRVFDFAKSKSNIEKEYIVHDYCLKHFKYDYDFHDYSFSPLGVVTNKVAVCEGFAKFTKLALDYLGVNSIVVTGKAQNPVNNKRESHAWNIVNIDNSNYHLDVTFDLTLKDKMNRYDYFNLCGDDIRKDHSFDRNVPICNKKGADYFTVNSLLASNATLFSKIVTAELKSGKRTVMVKLTDVKNMTNTIEKVMDISAKKYLEVCKSNAEVSVSYNSTQCVFEINFDLI